MDRSSLRTYVEDAFTAFADRYLMPDSEEENVYDIDLQDLQDQGYGAIIIDLDQTLTSYNGTQATDEQVEEWYDEALDEFDICILSNDAGKDMERAEEVSENFNTGVVAIEHKKPWWFTFDRAVDYLDADPDDTVMIGDLPFTDIVGGNWYGVHTIQVDPLETDDPRHIKATRRAGHFLQDIYREHYS